LTESRIFKFGRSRRKAASNRGTKYSAVVVETMCNSPAIPFNSSSAASASRQRESIARACSTSRTNVCEVHTPPHLFEQRQAYVCLELLELDRDCRLREMQLGRGPAEVKISCRRLKYAELLERGSAERCHLSISL
jgi:hypothetical protein